MVHLSSSTAYIKYMQNFQNIKSAPWDLQDVYNFMVDYENDPVILTSGGWNPVMMGRDPRYLGAKKSSSGDGVDLYSLMNGPIKDKLKIIPQNVR